MWKKYGTIAIVSLVVLWFVEADPLGLNIKGTLGMS